MISCFCIISTFHVVQIRIFNNPNLPGGSRSLRYALVLYNPPFSNPSYVKRLTSLIKVQNEHSTLGCDQHFEDKSNILERYYNCDAPIYSGVQRDAEINYKAGVKEYI